MFQTPTRSSALIPNGNNLDQTPPQCIPNLNNWASAEKSPAVPSPGSIGTMSPSETRRGRPRAEVLNTLIIQGSHSPSTIRCVYCQRVFPREKSLQAHLRTHTGEKPYVCDFPRCTRRFAQSGQLKTHQRLHTGEKPFVCSAPNCDRKFTHANRHCPEHPDLQLKRYSSSTSISLEKINDEEHSHAVQKWLNKKKDKVSVLSTPRKFRQSQSERKVQNENIYSGNTRGKSLSMDFECSASNNKVLNNITDKMNVQPRTPMRENPLEIASQALIDLHKGAFTGQQLFQGQDSCKFVSESDGAPKKRWLKVAVKEQLCDANHDLAKPINWEDDFSIIEHENQKRPTVLVRVNQGERKEISKSDMQVAMALVELKNANTNANGDLYTF